MKRKKKLVDYFELLKKNQFFAYNLKRCYLYHQEIICLALHLSTAQYIVNMHSVEKKKVSNN